MADKDTQFLLDLHNHTRTLKRSDRFGTLLPSVAVSAFLEYPIVFSSALYPVSVRAATIRCRLEIQVLTSESVCESFSPSIVCVFF